MQLNILGMVATILSMLEITALATPLTMDDLRILQTKKGARAQVESLCGGWNWEMIDASIFVHKDFGGDKHFMIDKAQVVDQRTEAKFVAVIVINISTGTAHSMSEEELVSFLQRGEIPRGINREPVLEVN